jgi:hypothetical protein
MASSNPIQISPEDGSMDSCRRGTKGTVPIRVDTWYHGQRRSVAVRSDIGDVVAIVPPLVIVEPEGKGCCWTNNGWAVVSVGWSSKRKRRKKLQRCEILGAWLKGDTVE